MTILYPANGPNPSSWMYPIQIQQWSTLIQQFGAPSVTLGQKIPNFCHFWALLGPLVHPHNHFVPGKWPKPIILDVSDPDPTMIHSERAIWGTQGDLWSKIPNFRHFWALLGLLAPPHGHFVCGKWPKPIILDVSHPDPTMIHFHPAIWGAQGDLWPQKAFCAIFGPFLAIKWVKMAFENRCRFGSQPTSTWLTRWLYWFCWNNNFVNLPPFNTLWDSKNLIFGSKFHNHNWSAHRKNSPWTRPGNGQTRLVLLRNDQKKIFQQGVVSCPV